MKEAEFEDFDDIYYGMGTSSEPYFFFSFLSAWNIMITCSSTASESMVLSKQSGSDVFPFKNFQLWVLKFVCVMHVCRWLGRNGTWRMKVVLNCLLMALMTHSLVACAWT